MKYQYKGVIIHEDSNKRKSWRWTYQDSRTGKIYKCLSLDTAKRCIDLIPGELTVVA